MNDTHSHRSLKTVNKLPHENGFHAMDLKVIKEKTNHWILTNDEGSVHIEWPKKNAPGLEIGGQLHLTLQTPDQQKAGQLNDLRQLLQELIQ